MNLDPTKLNKYLYIERTPTWRVRVLYGFGTMSWLLVLLAFSFPISFDPFYRYFVAPILVVLSLFYLSSYVLNMFYRKFDLRKHNDALRSFWLDRRQVPVDIFLPICGEDEAVLRNTWRHVSRIRYMNKKVYVLNDTVGDELDYQKLANEFGFNYIERPNRGEMKKAGNLKFAFERTSGDVIAVFDADFAPHPDFLRELIPYMSDPKVAIVQTPQYFQTDEDVYKRSKLEYGSAYVQEDFYRVIQVARNQLGGALCCGSNAIYRRRALEEIGGPLQVHYSEDSRTGVALVAKGWIVRYIPIILAIGLCPNNPYAYFHQQHRWSSGSMELLSGWKEFWKGNIPIATRLCYLSGFLYYLHHPFSMLISLQLFFVLYLYTDLVSFSGAILFYPYLFFSFILLPIFHIARFRCGVFLAAATQLYAYTHAVVTVLLLRKSVSWIPTNIKHSFYSRAFSQSVLTMSTYVLIYVGLIALGIRAGVFHPFIYSYYSVQFWIFYNLTFSILVLWYFFSVMDQMQKTRISGVALALWRARTAGAYVTLTFGAFTAILLI